MPPNSLSSVSNARTLREIGAFWDEHDFSDFDTDAPDVEYHISSTVVIEPDLLSAIAEQADMRGVGVETLVNLWLQEKLTEQRSLALA